MIRAEPKELNREVVPVIEAHLSEKEVSRLVPVEMIQLDPLAEAEPSLGALLRLETGQFAVVVYGTETHTLSLRLPENEVSPKTIETVLSEIRIPSEAISWRCEPSLTSATSGTADGPRTAKTRGRLETGRYLAQVSRRSTKAARSTKPKKPAKGTTTSKTNTGAAASKSGLKKGQRIAAATTGVAAAAAAAGVAFFRATKDNTPAGRKVYHVSPTEEGWEVKGQGADRAVSTHFTKKEALTAARELAYDQVPSRLVVHKSDGAIQESWSYDADTM